MKQVALNEYISLLEKNELLHRIKEEVEVDEIPTIIDDHRNKALFIEKIKDSTFPMLTNAYSSRKMYALALGCKEDELLKELVKRLENPIPPTKVDTAPCKDIILKGDDIDLTKFPLFLHHLYDGHAFLTDGCMITSDPESGEIDWGVYRIMYRDKNEVNVHMQFPTHIGNINAHKYYKKGEDMPVCIMLGGSCLEKIGTALNLPNATDWEVLGGLYGESTKVVSAETNHLTIPANAEIVIEGRILTSEGWIWDEGPFGEYAGLYSAGFPKDCRMIIDCITMRENSIYQYASLGGATPWMSDTAVALPTAEALTYMKLKQNEIPVDHVVYTNTGMANVCYVSIDSNDAEIAQKTLKVLLADPKSARPCYAYVFHKDVDLNDTEKTQWSLAWHCHLPDDLFLPAKGMKPDEEGYAIMQKKIGFNCVPTIHNEVDQFNTTIAAITPPFEKSTTCKVIEIEELTQKMEAFIRQQPRRWFDILEEFSGQPYPTLYKTFGILRPRLSRNEERPDYTYFLKDK